MSSLSYKSLEMRRHSHKTGRWSAGSSVTSAPLSDRFAISQCHPLTSKVGGQMKLNDIYVGAKISFEIHSFLIIQIFHEITEVPSTWN